MAIHCSSRVVGCRAAFTMTDSFLERGGRMFQVVLDFWFKEIQPVQRFKKDEAFDLLIIERFADTHQKASQGELFKWRESALGRLAEIIVLDQFSRNMFRGTPASFEFDALALVLSQELISQGLDKLLSEVERSFVYMPFMHSESLAIHEVALELFKQNKNSANLDFEIKHKRIIERFGRYPHRNEILGRESTQEEIEFLTQPGSGF